MPSTLPPSILDGPPASASSFAGSSGPLPPAGTPDSPAAAAAGTKTPYVASASSGAAAHPDDILASCQALRGYLAKMQADADADLRRLEERIQERDLAEKRRLAPGWLDSDARLLVPERPPQQQPHGGDDDKGSSAEAALPSEMAAPVPQASTAAEAAKKAEVEAAAAGGITAEALDRAFGSIQIR